MSSNYGRDNKITAKKTKKKLSSPSVKLRSLMGPKFIIICNKMSNYLFVEEDRRVHQWN